MADTIRAIIDAFSNKVYDYDRVIKHLDNEKKRIENLVFFNECKTIQNFPQSDSVFHFHPIGLVAEFKQCSKGIYTNPYKIKHIPSNNMHRTGTVINAEYLTIHSTGNPNSTASNEWSWLTNPMNQRKAEFHIVIDENEAIECIPLNERARHAGDTEGNNKSISIEIVESGDREKILRQAIRLTAHIMNEKKWSIDKLKQHKDWSGKVCPRILINPTINNGAKHQTWDWFKNKVGELLCD
jgi:N-acetylmuramoyl-L-alanine amidase